MIVHDAVTCRSGNQAAFYSCFAQSSPKDSKMSREKRRYYSDDNGKLLLHNLFNCTIEQEMVRW